MSSIEFLWWGGSHSHFLVQPNCSVEVVMCSVVVGVVTIVKGCLRWSRTVVKNNSLRLGKFTLSCYFSR